MDKVCSVCGDKALGYNFNAVTCESCKAFFRRNALSSKDFSCPFNETCEITVVTRRFCQRCRLQKCFKIGMRKEYIMTEEDKLLKRKKVEMNRAKRKSKLSSTGSDETVSKVKKEPENLLNDFWTHDNMMDTNQIDLSPGSVNSECASGYQSVASTISNSSMSPTSSTISQYQTPNLQQQSPPLQMPFQQTTDPSSAIPVNITSTNIPSAITNTISSTTNQYQMGIQPTASRPEYPTKDSNTCDIVNFFLNHPSESSNYVNHLMFNQKAALEVMTKIIQSQKDAMKMIGHLIGSPGDALKMISKLMNSPYNALTVFTKFMASPNDALEIIAKCVNSPADVVQFFQQLMSTPDAAVDIVNKFMNEPAEAMKILNDMVDITMVDSTTKMENSELGHHITPPEPSDTKQNELIPNDTVTDTLFCTKHVSSPMVRSLLESAPSEISHNTSKATPNTENIENITNKDRPNTLEALINDAIKIEYNLLGRESNVSRELNDSETAKLNELIVAYKALFVPLDEDITPLVRERNDSTKKVLHQS